MTVLEEWAKEACDELFGEHHPIQLRGAWMKGYQASSERRHTPIEECPPGHNCPDCGTSLIEGITD